jgi:hypothetical protein
LFEGAIVDQVTIVLLAELSREVREGAAADLVGKLVLEAGLELGDLYETRLVYVEVTDSPPDTVPPVRILADQL